MSFEYHFVMNLLQVLILIAIWATTRHRRQIVCS